MWTSTTGNDPEIIPLMAGAFGASVVINRPIDDVFAFLLDGQNDPKFSARVQQMEKATDGPPGVGTIYKSTVVDAGMNDAAGVRAHRGRRAEQDPLGRAFQEHGHGARGRL